MSVKGKLTIRDSVKLRCWFRSDKRCSTPVDCLVAGRCCECWNPAMCDAVRAGAGGALWVWAV
jgi:hypothetical protein